VGKNLVDPAGLVEQATYLTILPYRNPFLLAKSVPTHGLLWGGRVELGMGAGSMKTEFGALGVDLHGRPLRPIAPCHDTCPGGRADRP
jgi:hypothetical protein